MVCRWFWVVFWMIFGSRKLPKMKIAQIAKTTFLQKPENYWFSLGKIDIFKVSKVWNLNEHHTKNSKNRHVFWTWILGHFGMGFGRDFGGQKPRFLLIFRSKIDDKKASCFGRLQKASKIRKMWSQEALPAWEGGQVEVVFAQLACWGGRGGTTKNQQLII